MPSDPPSSKKPWEESPERMAEEIGRLLRENNRLKEEIVRLRNAKTESSGRHTIHGLSAMVVVLDTQDNVTYINSAMERLLGRPRTDFIGRPASQMYGNGLAPGFLDTSIWLARQGGKDQSDLVMRDEGSGAMRHLTVKVTTGRDGTQILIEDQSKLRVLERTFSRYVSPKVIEEVLKQELDPFGARKYELSVLFADLRGFTAASADMDVAIVKRIIDEYLRSAIDVVINNDATVDKIVGDEVMALFGAPIPASDHASRAINTAIKIQQAHQHVMATWREAGLPALELGIGINSGLMVVGNIGSEKRMDYTVLGHNVNVAARLCSAAKPGEILVSRNTRELFKHDILQTPSHMSVAFEFVRREPVAAKGIREPVEVFSLLFKAQTPRPAPAPPLRADGIRTPSNAGLHAAGVRITDPSATSAPKPASTPAPETTPPPAASPSAHPSFEELPFVPPSFEDATKPSGGRR